MDTTGTGDPIDRAFGRYRTIVPAWDAFRAALRRPLPVNLWANPQRIGRDQLRTLLADEGIPSEPVSWHGLALRLQPPFSPGRHWGLFAGLFQSQEEVAMLPAVLLGARPGERVLDLCAAPGNKTAQIALAMDNTGTVVANDVQRGRLSALRQVIKRLGLVNVSVTLRPGQDYPLRAGAFDRVLVDAPCSGEGIWRKGEGPRSGPPAPEADTALRRRLADRQYRLLCRAVRLCRPGGRVVYSTCTLAPEENEAVVDAVLRTYGDGIALGDAHLTGFAASAGLTAWEGSTFAADLARTARIWPQQNDTGGFFVAVIDRLGGDAPVASPQPVEAADPAPLDALLERFGIPEDALRGLVPMAVGSRYLHLIAADHRLVPGFEPETGGLPAIGLQARPWKPTTAAAMAFGGQATRNRVDLAAAEAQAFIRREPLRIPAPRLQDVSGPGYVLVRYRGYVLGMGYVRDTVREGAAALASLFPKAWTGTARVPGA